MSKQVTKTDKSKAGKDKKKDEPKVEEFPEMTGTGTFIYPNKAMYIGEYKQLTTGVKIREGKGKLIQPSNPEQGDIGSEWYEGDWKNDQMDGYGEYHYSNGDIYEGNWKNNMHNGFGRYIFTNGNTYEGEWKDHKMEGHGKYLNMDNLGWEGEFKEGGFHSRDQPDLVEAKRISTKIEKMKEIPMEIFKLWEDTFSKCDKKTIKDQLSPFFAKAETMGQYIQETFPKFEDKTPDKWNEAFRWAFGQSAKAAAPGKGLDPKDAPKVNITINVPRDGNDLLFMNKEGLLTKQVQEDLSNGQVIEILSVLEPRKISLGIGYSKDIDKWLVVYFSDITEKGKK